MTSPTWIWETPDQELIWLQEEIRKELNLRAICNEKDLPYPTLDETPMFLETYGG